MKHLLAPDAQLHRWHLLALAQLCPDRGAREPRECWVDMKNARKMAALYTDMKMPERPPFTRTVASMLAGSLATLALGGCGAEVAGGAAALGAMEARQAEQARAQQAQVVDKFKAAQDAGVARAASAAD